MSLPYSYDVFTKSAVANFYHFSHTPETLPFWCHPVTFQKIEKSIWTNCGAYKCRCRPTTTNEAAPPGFTIHNTLPMEITSKLIMVRDGSVHLCKQQAEGAWIIATLDDKFLSGCLLLADVPLLTAYRIKLEGMFRVLKHIKHLGMSPTEVAQWCNNKAAVTKSEPGLTPCQMISPKADIIMAIHHLRSKLVAPVTCSHVCGHQEGKNKAKMSGKPPKQEVQMNIGCNETIEAILSAAGHIPEQQILQPPYEGSKAMLHIAGKWIMSDTTKHIHWAH